LKPCHIVSTIGNHCGLSDRPDRLSDKTSRFTVYQHLNTYQQPQGNEHAS